MQVFSLSLSLHLCNHHLHLGNDRIHAEVTGNLVYLSQPQLMDDCKLVHVCEEREKM